MKLLNTIKKRIRVELIRSFCDDDLTIIAEISIERCRSHLSISFRFSVVALLRLSRVFNFTPHRQFEISYTLASLVRFFVAQQYQVHKQRTEMKSARQ